MSLEDLLRLGEAPAGVLLVVLVTVILVGVSRKAWVPGWLYAQERERSDRLEAAMAALTKAVEAVLDDRDWNERDRHAARSRRTGA